MKLKEMASGMATRLARKYRVNLVDNESLGTLRMWRVRPWSLILMGGLLLGGIAAGTIFLAKMTGYFKTGNAPDTEEYKSMLSQVDSLKQQIQAQNAYIESFRRGTGIDFSGPDSAQIANLSDPSQNAHPDAHDFEHNNDPGVGQSAASVTEPRSGISNQGRLDLSRLNLIPPVDGVVTQGYDHQGNDEQHYGVDLVADQNSMIRAVADGVVIFSEYSGQTGYVIAVMHPQYNLVSFYKHNSRVFKTTGSYVFAGEAIAVIGQSGRNQSGTHLHFELWYNGNPINPQEYILF